MPDLYLAVGSLNREAPYFQGARGEGLTIFAFDPQTGAASRICNDGSIDNPTFFSTDPARGMLYANSEVFGWHEGTISAYRFDPHSGALIYLNKQSCQGSITAHNSLTRDGRFVLVANYAAGAGGPDQSLVALPLQDDGTLGPVAGSVRHQGKLGPDSDRQERTHAHCVIQTVGRLILSADLGLDQVIAYHLSPAGEFRRISHVDMAPGSGPRHIAADPTGYFAYVANELDSTVSLIRIDGDLLHLVQTLPTVPEGVQSHGADIHISPDGRFLYCSNRGHDSLAIFQIDRADGTMTPAGYVPSGGATPRNFTLSPDGQWLLAANQNGDCITVFARDNATGALRDSGKTIHIGTPVCVRFLTA